MTSLLSEIAALENSADPEKREVGARLRTAIRNVLVGIAEELNASYALNGWPEGAREVKGSRRHWEVRGTPAGTPGWFYKEWYTQKDKA